MAEKTQVLMGCALLGTQPFLSLEETGPGIGQRRSVERKMSTLLDFQLRSFSKSYPLNCRNNLKKGLCFGQVILDREQTR